MVDILSQSILAGFQHFLTSVKDPMEVPMEHLYK